MREPAMTLKRYRSDDPADLCQISLMVCKETGNPALGMPMVMSDLPPSRPFVADGKCAFMVPPDDYGAYADAVIQLLKDPKLREQMGNEGRKRGKQEFNWERESQKLLSLYQELLSE
jgi:glycosyltransferase involved in cell wall biosynthesis